MAKQVSQPLVSIVVPVYSYESLSLECLNSLLEQTYPNIEVIIAKGLDTTTSSIAKFNQGNKKIKIVELDAVQGQFKIRLEGMKAATGDYLLTVNSTDSLSIDYVRTLLVNANENTSDIVLPEVVIKDNVQEFIYNLANDFPFEHLEGKECIDKFFDQGGDNYRWYQVTGSLYSNRIVKSALSFLGDARIDTDAAEDLLFSVVLWSFTERVDTSPTAYYYLGERVEESHKDVNWLRKNIQDISIVSTVILDFLKSQGTSDEREQKFVEWMNLYSRDFHNRINSLSISDQQKRELRKLMQFGNEDWNQRYQSEFYNVKTSFNDSLEHMKRTILDDTIKVVSFDIFDTLVVRPFLAPSDLFYLLDQGFKELEKKFRLQNFHDIRIESEKLARAQDNTNEDISLAQIYEVMKKEFFVDGGVAEKMLAQELLYEVRYCSQRRTAKELYDLAQYAGKKVIITSDMYLPIGVLEEILDNNSFRNYDALYVSSHHGTMKATQNLYRHIATELGEEPASIVHIGDNYESDVVAAKNAGWKGLYFPKTTEVSPEVFGKMFVEDEEYARSHLGVTAAYAVATNKYFDNPFRSFLQESNYNCSPYFMGYFALGLTMLGFTEWMIEDMKKKKITSAVFLGRDGYLPKRIFDIFQQAYDLPIESHYLPTSRKATIPLAIFSQWNVSDIRTFNYLGYATESIVDSLKPYVMNSSSTDLKDIDYEAIKKLHTAFINTYKNYFKDRTAVMDIGYSGRPEQILANLVGTSIETYFMYASNDEAKRRLGKTVNIYGRLKIAPIREKLISEIGPSCIAYQVKGDRVKPVYEDIPHMSYYEKFFLENAQRGATDFVKDFLRLFGNHLDYMNFGDNHLTLQPLDQATIVPRGLDREMYRGIMHEDSVAVDRSISIFDEYYGKQGTQEDSHMSDEAARLEAELSAHMGIKRSAKLLAGNIKRRIRYGKKR